MNADNRIGVEVGVHGKAWNGLHDGYFSDPAVAKSLLDAICRELPQSGADSLADLGGGTGYILSQLLSRGAANGISLVNLDCSQAQLDAGDGRISRVMGSIDTFARRDLAGPDARLFFIMRSALHYFGRDGLAAVLRHIRGQAKPGEMFVHQTACFDDPRAEACINALYRKMATDKWYPLADRLAELSTQTGWRILSSRPAPPLKLTSHDLTRRYGLTADTVRRIRDELMKEFGEIENIFQPLPDGFVAHLPYNIFVTEAAQQTM